MIDLDAQEAADWRKLGVWYDYTPSDGWILRGSRSGIGRFVETLLAYAANPRNAEVGEHEHYGPFMYLKVVTHPSSEINSHGIYGRPEDVRTFAALLRERVAKAVAGESIEVSKTYSPASDTPFTVWLEHDFFDPAVYDRENR
jgi:hypothetical protein